MNDAAPSADLLLNRRRFLGCAALFGVAGPLLVACSSGDSSSDASPSADGSGDDSGDAGDGAGEDTGGAAGAVLVATAEVPVGGGVILTDLNIAVTQPTEGEFKAFDSRCTHQGTPIDQPQKGVMTCPLHGSQFGLEGENLAGPFDGPAGSTPDLTEIAVTVDGDNVVRA